MTNPAIRAQELRNQGIALVKAGDRVNGQELLVQALELHPQDEYAWIWLSSVVDNLEERRFCLQKVLEVNPQQEAARRALAGLGAPPVPVPALAHSAVAAAPAAAPGVHAVLAAAPAPDTSTMASSYQDDPWTQYQARQERAKRRDASLWGLGMMGICLALGLFLCLQIYRQAQVRGWIEGRRIETHRVTQKYQSFGRRGPSYWVSWTRIDVREPGNHRTSMEYDEWARLQVGSPIRLIFIPTTRTPFLAEGDIWANDGNVWFNVILGGGAMLMALGSGWYAFYVNKHGVPE